ncbi:MAG: type III polyketide synthase [Rhodospirillales bacterium]|nr:type III polyketide synthase [Rhodospirillales bacterium]
MSRASQHRPALLSLTTAVPPYRLEQADVARFGEALFGGSFADFQRLVPVYANAAIAKRHSCVPIEWYAEPHGFGDRNGLFVDHAVTLLEDAADRALAQAGLERRDIDMIVSVSSSGIATPSLDALLVERMKLRRDVQRLPVFGLGCAGGILGLARAAQMALSRPGARVLLLVVELCGLTFRHGDRSKSNVIATALFGDGAAAAVLTAEPDDNAASAQPTLRAWGEHTWPGMLDVMGWQVADDGLGVLFSRDIPAIIRGHFRDALDEFLENNGLSLADFDAFGLHPGGAKVLDALEDVLGLANGALTDSRAILRDYGNMSAVTVLFVLQRVLSRGAPPRRILLSSLGPGFTAAFGVVERIERR